MMIMMPGKIKIIRKELENLKNILYNTVVSDNASNSVYLTPTKILKSNIYFDNDIFKHIHNIEKALNDRGEKMDSEKMQRSISVIRLSEIIKQKAEEIETIVTLLSKDIPATAKNNLREASRSMKKAIETIEKIER